MKIQVAERANAKRKEWQDMQWRQQTAPAIRRAAKLREDPNTEAITFDCLKMVSRLTGMGVMTRSKGSMYTCMHMYMYMYIYTCIYVYIYIYTYLLALDGTSIYSGRPLTFVEKNL